MKRFAFKYLIDWKKNKERKPLLINGARQVGKTWLMKNLGKNHYKSYLYINFETNKEMRALFSQSLDTQKLIEGLNIENKEKIDPSNTLIIFDEIQECPQAITSLKYFYEKNPEFHIVAAGSLLGVALHEGISYPVGKVNFMDLYPLSFSEFLDAIGEEKLSELINTNDHSLITPFKDKLIDYLKKYFYVGGMPEAVLNFSKNNDFKAVREIQQQILTGYEKDFSKHVASNILPKVRMIWNSVPAQLSKENKKFNYNLVKENSRAKDFEDAISWLENSGLIYKVNKISKPAIPLKSYQDDSIFKIFTLDIGLLCAMNMIEPDILLKGSEIFTEFKGSLTEQFVLQELKTIKDLHSCYWKNDNATSEVDFVVQYKSKIVPIEVKAGTNLKAKSLKVYIDKYSPEIALRSSLSDYKKNDKLFDIPLFALKPFILNKL